MKLFGSDGSSDTLNPYLAVAPRIFLELCLWFGALALFLKAFA